MRIKDLPKIEALIKTDGVPEFVVLRFTNYKKFIQKAGVEGRIDEEDYLARYPDVQRAMSENRVKTATEHYVNTGYVEQRSAKVLDGSEPSDVAPAATSASTAAASTGAETAAPKAPPPVKRPAPPPPLRTRG